MFVVIHKHKLTTGGEVKLEHSTSQELPPKWNHVSENWIITPKNSHYFLRVVKGQCIKNEEIEK